MKKFATLLIVFAMLLSLVACSGDTSDKDDEKDETKTSETADNSEAAGDDESESSEDEKKPEKDEPEKDKPEKDEPEKDKPEKEDHEDGKNGFTEMVVVDNDECVITLTGIDPDNMWGYTINAVLENKSADKTYMFSVETGSVNGVQSDPFFAQEVAAGKKANTEIFFMRDNLEENGITEYTDIELSFIVSDYDDWSAGYVAEETVHIYPYGEAKAEKFVRKEQASDIVLFDNEDISIVAINSGDDLFGYTVDLYIVNKSDKNLTISADDVSVNGFMADPFYATTVFAGKCTFSSIIWSETTFEENGITDVEEIEFSLDIYDADDWTYYVEDEMIKFNP